MIAAMNGSEMYVMYQSVLQTAKNKFILCKFIKLDLRTTKCNSGITERSRRQTELEMTKVKIFSLKFFWNIFLTNTHTNTYTGAN